MVLRDHAAAVVLAGLLTWMLSAAVVVIILMTPALMETTYGLSAIVAPRANSFATVGLTAGCVLAGWLTDRLGSRRVLLIGCPLLGIAAYLLYVGVRLNPLLVTPLYLLAGFSVGVVAVVTIGIFLTDRLPNHFLGVYHPPTLFNGRRSRSPKSCNGTPERENVMLTFDQQPKHELSSCSFERKAYD